MKGRNTRVIGIRVADKVYQDIVARAGSVSAGEYVKQLLLSSLYSVNHANNAPALDQDGQKIPDYW